ncbi:MAG: hypothetical protein MJ194_07420 [Clostridia bacterium]|nr:hypothetical protein [Clostridia bacterium]
MFNVKKSTYILATIVFISLLTSCGRENLSVVHESLSGSSTVSEASQHESLTNTIAGLDYSCGKRLCHLERNRLNIDTFSESDGSLYYYAISRVGGLTDNRITSAVNNRIYDLTKTWCSGRPLPEESELEGFTDDMISSACYGVSSVITLNCSDYFSGVLKRTIDFYDPEDQGHTLLTYYYPTNFDLHSGDEFSLASLFCNGAEYMQIINTRILRYASDNGLSVRNFAGIPEDNPFSLSEDGIVIYIDDSFEKIGLPAGTEITIDYSAFGDTLVIERPCSDIYIDRESAGVKLIRSSESSQIANETVFFDEGDKLTAKVTHTAPEGFPETLFEEADKFIGNYVPDEKSAEKIRTTEGDYLRINCDITGYYIGAYSCVTLSANIKQSKEAPITAYRSYVYDAEGSEISVEKCFDEEFDVNTFVSGALANTVNALMDDGWTIEEEIDVSDIDFFLNSESITFTTLPARMSRKVTNPDGSEQTESHRDSIVAEMTFEATGVSNLVITEQ